MSRKSLDTARQNRKDEFYTQRETVEKEMPFYDFHGMHVYLNCDDPANSEFWFFFKDNFAKLGLRKLTATYLGKKGKTFKTSYWIDKAGKHLEKERLKGNGSFDSKECLQILKECDVVVTNPPYSKVRDFMKVIFENNKKYLILSNINIVTYKEIHEQVVNGNLRIGPSIKGGDVEFRVPGNYPLNAKSWRVDEDGTRYVRVTSIRWITNLEHNCFPEPIPLHTRRWNLRNNEKLIKTLTARYGAEKYPKYDNLNAYEVPLSNSIPSDVKGVMGVPISFLDKYNPNQFDIVGIRKGDDGKDLTINGKPTYCRILIRRKETACLS